MYNSVYNLLEYGDNYSMKSRNLWNYDRNEVSVAANENYGANYRVNNNKTTTSKSFEYKTKTIGKKTSYC